MRLHRNLVFAVIDALKQIFNDGEYADKVIEKVLRYDKRWGARDRAFIAETTYDIVRWKRLYTEIAEAHEPYTRQHLFRLFAVWCVLKGIPLPDWKQMEETPERRIKGRFDELSKIRKFRESVPDWMDELGEKSLGNKLWTKEIAALNQQADVILRVNTLKITKPQLKLFLAKEDIETVEIDGYPDALKLKERKNVFTTEAFKDGLFEVQDASSQLVAPYLEVQPGQRVVDACAGAGGKTLHLASLMQNKGQLIALDIYESKLKKLKIRARRNGIHNFETRPIDSTKVIKKLHNSADRLLLDAPCSGLGVIKRNPDSKWKLEPEFIDRIMGVQQDILQNYSKMVKKGGQMVYATCSILPQENTEQVKKFLESENGKEFELVREQNVYASETGFDGFYMALMKRN
ncbi:16S rRNA (cytosine967-C5)-methyltransferase [Flagellimonas taeanensis]|jgi:16S rRNA (cytosine967-C5)-methyltransferase|uniref:16S rRNA (Cytosine967-C5)-methyltransferase n=1 Tax=Flagellimonas taeanensis TaxID=1005926 RepID=A0A1M7AE44_9FLAO|nr:methyltransferase domain-containing protein [Allomuricauda taeanensis]MEE1962610.1 methyltransferase domain-containing protein [Allomuricauda taeanensis]SFC33041.1 16S rRNA (cytosine967-C5)-methyltransferase [Allomuricauda taeanensis]SHL41031.1 16S rRNA (cytosine967-C5)-methyltransferase [Allomuricauda taeanensis]